MSNTTKQYKRQNDFNKLNYYKPSLSLPNKYKDYLQTKGKEYGSMTQYFIHLIETDMKQGGDNP